MKRKASWSPRRGSALLVVLGMLSFMVVSAVAFSAWMRYARLPSSYLRRSSASRQLAKAALAEAIDELDRAIANNPHPGLGDLVCRQKDDRNTETLRNCNTFAGRVFIGTNFVNNLVDPIDTVSTLTLEGLAYIPPPLVNEARYYSRRSVAAKWKRLNYDSGRYAFCAIDVSDYLDVNSLSANVGRSSSPGGRISLGHVFEDASHTSAPKGSKAWDDTFMKMFRNEAAAEVSAKGANRGQPDAAKVPLVSMADFNLALDTYGGSTTFKSPFCLFAEGSSGTDFYSGTQVEKVKQMTFVTDGWFPVKEQYSTSRDAKANALIDLADEDRQPFRRSDLKATGRAIRNVIDNQEDTIKRIGNYISRIGSCMLYDYLDDDCVPLSLAIPEVERTPMICGIKHNFASAQVVVKLAGYKDGFDMSMICNDNCPGASQAAPNATTRTVTYTALYKIDARAFADGIRGGSLEAFVAYPFRRSHDDPTFKIDGNISIFFTTANMGLRAGGADRIHVRGENTDPKIDSGKSKDDQNKDSDGVFHIALDPQDCTFSKVKDESTAVRKIDTFKPSLAAAATAIAQKLEEQTFVEVTYVQNETRRDDGNGNLGPWEKAGEPQTTGAFCGIPPHRADGSIDGDYAGNIPAERLGGQATFTVNAAVTLRIKDTKSGKTVDLVPAAMSDDQAYNGVNNAGSMTGEARRMGSDYPVAIFRGGSFAFSVADFEANKATAACDFAPKGVICPDPRWNWAPEHWYVEENVSESVWSNWLKEKRKDAKYEYLDQDIFMATSDAGYMQSVYELAFLPRITNLTIGDGNEVWGQLDSLMGSSQMNWAESFDKIDFNRRFQWVTYRPYDRRGIDRDPFDELNVVNEGGGTKINPFSDSTNVVMAAFANTPFDWWAASVDPDAQTGIDESERLNAESFNKKYAFNQYNSDAKIAWKDLTRIAGNFIGHVRHNLQPNDAPDDIWMDAFDSLDWSGELTANSADPDKARDYFGSSTQFDSGVLDGQTDDLTSADRKFLYGYWHDCFAARQQLFLVFVRAEPSMMGGGATGRTPPPLGARAVALVWRDPARTRDNVTPHRTRILFYRQFD